MPTDPRKNNLAGSSHEDMPPAAEVSSDEYTYSDILKSSALIGGSSVLSTAISVIRTKVLALLLGPVGFGLVAVYGSIADLARSIAEMGINNSGVRQIAEAVGSGDTKRVSRTVTLLRRISIILGTFGAALLVVFSNEVAILSFGNDHHAGAVALLSLAVLFRLVADGQGAVIQGMRRISDLAKIAVLGALFGTIVSIPLVYFLREDGIAPFLVSVAAMSVLSSWWYSRKVHIEPTTLTVTDVREEVATLMKLGFAFMANGFLTIGAGYAARIIVLRYVHVEAAGLYQAAWTLGGLYCYYIYQGIFSDFYPRLVGVANENPKCNRLVNEQTHVTLLLAVPGVLATLTFAPEVIHLFYSAEFKTAAEILRWICLGAALRVIFQPMGFIVVAKGKQNLFFATEFAWTMLNVSLTWLFVKSLGLNGAGIGFFLSYCFYGLMMYPVAHGLSGFRWSPANSKTGLISLISIGLVFGAFYTLPPLLATGIGMIVTIASSVHSIRVLLMLVSRQRIPLRWQRLLAAMRFLPKTVLSTFETQQVAHRQAKNGPTYSTAAETPPPLAASSSAPRRRSALVSILIPAFNADRWIAATLQSAIHQVWTNKEIIVVDDGSSDRTLEIARQFESRLVKVVSQENRGASTARNTALSLAQGDYVQWLDADDLLAPDKILRQMEFAEADRGASQLFSCRYGIFHYRLNKAVFNPTALWRDLAPIEWILKNFSETAWLVPAVWLISRQVMDRAGPWDERLSLNDDGEYVCRIVLASDHVKFVNAATCYYRSTSFAQLSRASSDQALKSLLLSLTLCIEHLRSFESSERTKNASLALLQMHLPYFHPYNTEALKVISALALELDGKLQSPVHPLTVDVLGKIVGRRATHKAIASVRRLKLAAAVKWDEALSK